MKRLKRDVKTIRFCVVAAQPNPYHHQHWHPHRLRHHHHLLSSTDRQRDSSCVMITQVMRMTDLEMNRFLFCPCVPSFMVLAPVLVLLSSTYTPDRLGIFTWLLEADPSTCLVSSVLLSLVFHLRSLTNSPSSLIIISPGASADSRKWREMKSAKIQQLCPLNCWHRGAERVVKGIRNRDMQEKMTSHHTA